MGDLQGLLILNKAKQLAERAPTNIRDDLTQEIALLILKGADPTIETLREARRVFFPRSLIQEKQFTPRILRQLKAKKGMSSLGWAIKSPKFAPVVPLSEFKPPDWAVIVFPENGRNVLWGCRICKAKGSTAGPQKASLGNSLKSHEKSLKHQSKAV